MQEKFKMNSDKVKKLRIEEDIQGIFKDICECKLEMIVNYCTNLLKEELIIEAVEEAVKEFDRIDSYEYNIHSYNQIENNIKEEEKISERAKNAYFIDDTGNEIKMEVELKGDGYTTVKTTKEEKELNNQKILERIKFIRENGIDKYEKLANLRVRAKRYTFDNAVPGDGVHRECNKEYEL